MYLSPSNIAARGALLLAAACIPWAAFASKSGAGTWRCGNTYTDQPCSGGKPVDLVDSRDASQKREADNLTRDAQTAADRMERDRLKLEAAHSGKRAALIDDHRPPQPTSQKKKKDKKDPVYVSAQHTATAPKKSAAKTRSKRAATD
jgi:hypothetical protein